MRHFTSPRPLLAVAAGLALLAGSAIPAAAQTPPDPVSVLQNLIASVDRNDPAPVQASYFAEDAVVLAGPCHDQPDQTCVGRAQIEQAIRTGGPVQVTLNPAPTLTGEGNVVQFRVEERFDLPPQATAAGIQRYVEVGQAVVNAGRIQRMAFQADVTDPQTVALIRLFASMGPPPGAQPAGPVANDGQTLAMQSPATQQLFNAAYGANAAAEWVRQHNAALSGSR